jgi:hypothetical protein
VTNKLETMLEQIGAEYDGDEYGDDEYKITLPHS